MFEWYTPIKKMVEPLDKDISVVKPHLRQFDPSAGPNPHRSHLEVAGKVTEGISLSQSSILSTAAKSALQRSFSRDMEANPYFPHFPPGNVDRLSGRRGWTEGENESVELPSPKRSQEYVATWK